MVGGLGSNALFAVVIERWEAWVLVLSVVVYGICAAALLRDLGVGCARVLLHQQVVLVGCVSLGAVGVQSAVLKTVFTLFTESLLLILFSESVFQLNSGFVFVSAVNIIVSSPTNPRKH